ncbi:hypothetical protein GCM10010275_35710 [Streptomyces litmocidini]|nr:hypothetical protein GCM10010275_35710 [Streptomyces litmocidini]
MGADDRAEVGSGLLVTLPTLVPGPEVRLRVEVLPLAVGHRSAHTMGAERKKGKKVTSHPPSGPPSVPPSGPPSGPLSGPSTRPGSAGPPPPPGPPHGGSGGGGGASGGGGGGASGGGGGTSGGDGAPSGGGSSRAGGSGKGGPWWRSVPKVASVTAALVAAAALAVVLTNRPDDKGGTAGSGGGEVFLQNAAATGPDPFTRSTARTGGGSAPPASLPPRTASAVPQMSGATPGLYGGTRSVASCDVEQQVRYLSSEPAKNAAFASVVGIPANGVPAYLRSLTPLQLRVDTRVTNHGFRNGAATTYQSVLQAGTAVMVDGHGVPRVRCACGNPLTGPVAQKAPRTTGTPWPGYSPQQVVVVAPSVTVVNVFVVYDPQDDGWFAREHGDTGEHDKPTTPPPPPTPVSPSASPSTSLSSSSSASPLSPVPCVTVTGGKPPAPVDGVTPPPCPSPLSPSESASPSSPPPSGSSSGPSDSTPPTESSSPESAPASDSSAGLTSRSPDQQTNRSTGTVSSIAPLSPSGPLPARAPVA